MRFIGRGDRLTCSIQVSANMARSWVPQPHLSREGKEGGKSLHPFNICYLLGVVSSPDRARSFREQAQLAATDDDRVGSGGFGPPPEF